MPVPLFGHSLAVSQDGAYVWATGGMTQWPTGGLSLGLEQPSTRVLRCGTWRVAAGRAGMESKQAHVRAGPAHAPRPRAFARASRAHAHTHARTPCACRLLCRYTIANGMWTEILDQVLAQACALHASWMDEGEAPRLHNLPANLHLGLHARPPRSPSPPPLHEHDTSVSAVSGCARGTHALPTRWMRHGGSLPHPTPPPPNSHRLPTALHRKLSAVDGRPPSVDRLTPACHLHLHRVAHPWPAPCAAPTRPEQTACCTRTGACSGRSSRQGSCSYTQPTRRALPQGPST